MQRKASRDHHGHISRKGASMPRRTSSRRRTGASNGAAATSNGDSRGCGVIGCPPISPSPVKRKNRSPVPEDSQMRGLTAPAAIRCTPFQSPKKKALAGGNDGRFNGPFDKENDLLCTKSSNGLSVSSEHGSTGAGSLQLSAFSAFSQHAPQSARRRGREEAAVSPPISSSSSSPPVPARVAEGSALPLLFAPATGSPDVRRTRSSRRTRRSNSRLSQGRESSNSNNNRLSSNSTGTSSDGGRNGSGNRTSPCLALAPVQAPVPGRELAAITPRRSSRSRSGAGSAAPGGRRAVTATAPSSAASANTSGGGPAGSCERAVGGARLRKVGGGGSDSVPEPGSSPHRSPIHRLTESLQKWDPGSRLGSAAGGLEEDDSSERVHDCTISNGSCYGRKMDAASGGGVAKEVGDSWSGKELRRTLEGERLVKGLTPRHSAASSEDIHPHGRFGDHSPISPASSVGSIALAGFDAGTPASAGRPWRASPRRAEGNVSGGSGARSTEGFGVVRMEESWSEDEADTPSIAMRLAFSPRNISRAARTLSGLSSSIPAVSSLGMAGAAVATADAGTPFIARWQQPMSPVVKGGRVSGTNTEVKQAFSPDSSALSRGRCGGLATERDFSASPEPRSFHSIRDIMDNGADDGKDDGGQVVLVPRRRRRSRLALELKTLEIPDATDVTMIEASSGSAPSNTTESAFSTVRKFAPLQDCGSTSHPLGSPVCKKQGIAGEEPECGSASTTACPGWEGPLEESSSVLDAQAGRSRGDSWSCRKSKARGSESAQTSNGYGFGIGNEGEGDVGDGIATETSVVALGISGLSGTDTSGASDMSTSFVRSRPIPDQSAFSSSRLGKGAVGPLSPSGGSGPAAVGLAPMCLTPRKSMMRCPPTPQRTPTWDGLEDSLLLEGAGSGGGGGVGSAGISTRHSLRLSKLLVSSGGSGSGTAAVVGSGLAIDTALANASSTARGDALLEAETRSGSGGGPSRGRAGGRWGKGRGAKEPFSRSLSASAKRGHTFEATNSEYVDQTQTGVTSSSKDAAGDGALGFKHEFVQMGPIGEGGFSVVWKVRARRTGRLYAIKRSKREFRGRRDRDRCLLEARALQRLGDHPGVLRFERAWQEEGHFCLQTELCELGTLKDFLERLPSRKEIPEAAIWQIVQDVGQALRHVHATGLVHLDVKPANLLIGDEGGRLKLADFGMATTYGDGVEGVGDGQEGDTLYMAKELLSSTKRLPSADIFSLGLTVYEVATRAELPGDGEDWHAMRDGRAVELPASRSKELRAILRQLMNPDPTRRPTADELCRHPRVADVFEGTSGSTGARDDYVVSQARAWKAAEAAAMDHPSNGLRTPTGDMSARYIFQQNC